MIRSRLVRAVAVVCLVGSMLPFWVATAVAAVSTVPVYPTSTANVFTNGWFGYGDRGTAAGLASIGVAPGAQILGDGSLAMSNTAFGWEVAAFGTPAVPAGTPLSDITDLSYATYTPSGQAFITVQHVSLQFTIDYDVTDSYQGFQGRLVFEPYHCNTVGLDAWATWDTLAVGDGRGCWWQTANPLSSPGPTTDRAPWVGDVRQTGSLPCPMGNPCTWDEVKLAYPDAGFHPTNLATGLIFKVGTPWLGTFYTDALVVGFGGDVTTYDFDPASTPAAIKDVVIFELQGMLPTGDANTDKRIQTAIDRIQKSLTAEWWIDDETLAAKGGNKVFDEEKKAVQQLTKKPLDTNPVAQDLVQAILDADRALAQKAIDDAIALPGKASDIAKAQDELAKGDTERANGKYPQAVDRYKKAWENAEKAMK